MGKRRAPAVSPVPVWTVAVGGLALAFLVLPLVFMAGRVPWGRLPWILASEESVAALGLSLRTCAAALAVLLAAERDEGTVDLSSPGGRLAVRIAAGRAYLTGPAVLVAEFALLGIAGYVQ